MDGTGLPAVSISSQKDFLPASAQPSGTVTLSCPAPAAKEMSLPEKKLTLSHPASGSVAIDTRSVSVQSPSTLMDQLSGLEADEYLTDALKDKVQQFAEEILELEVPLYQADFITLFEKIKYLHKLCSNDGSSPENVPAYFVQSVLTDISRLYPVLLEADTPMVYQLIDRLFDHGVVKGGTDAYPGLSIGKIIYIVKLLIRIPFASFERVCTPLLKDGSFREAFFYDYPADFINLPDPSFFDFWITQAKIHIHNQHVFDRCYQKALNKVFFGETWKTFPNGSDKLADEVWQRVAVDALGKACNHDYACVLGSKRNDFDLQVTFSSARKLLEANPGVVSPLFTQYLKSLSRQQQGQLLLGAYMSTAFSIVKLLLNISPDNEALIQWRDQQGKNLLHYNGGLSSIFFGKSYIWEQSGLLTQRALTGLLNIRDFSDRTPLESFFSSVHDYEVDPKTLMHTPFMIILEKTIELTGLPWHCDELLSAVSPQNGFQAWLLVQLVQRGLDPSHLLDSENKNQQATPFARSFKTLLCRFHPLRTPEQQTGFLAEAKALGFNSEAARILIGAFPVPVRTAYITFPFTEADRPVWQSQVLPLPQQFLDGVATIKQLPWSSRLQEAFECYQPLDNKKILSYWSECLEQTAKEDQLDEFTSPLPGGVHGIYGRSCFFTNPDDNSTLRLKFRKKRPEGTPVAEPWEVFAGEPVKLKALRQLQSSGDLPLNSHLPEPIGMYRICDFKQWLSRSPLSPRDQKALAEQVYIEEDGSACVYAYQTQSGEDYHLYPYEHKTADFPLEKGLEALRLAAHDLGLLVRAGLAATVLPMYHDESTGRHYMVLAQLCTKICPGTLDSWNDQATSFPNISPGVGIRDYADISPFSDLPMVLERKVKDTPDHHRKIHMEQVAREFFSLTLLLARTMGDRLDHRNKAAVQSLAQNIQQMTSAFFSKAFDLPAEVIENAMTHYGIPDRLAREMSFWCDASEHPGWVKCLRGETSIPAEAYPEQYSTPFDTKVGTAVTDRGAFNTTRSTGRNLGHRNGMLPIMEVNKLLTLVFNLYVHKEQALATFHEHSS